VLKGRLIAARRYICTTVVAEAVSIITLNYLRKHIQKVRLSWNARIDSLG